MRPSARAAGPALLALLAAAPALADGVPPTAGGFFVVTGVLTPPGGWVVQPLFFGAAAFGSHDEQGRLHALQPGELAQALTVQMFVERGLSDRFAVGAQPSFVVNRRRLDGEEAVRAGLGELALFGRYGIQIDPASAWPQASALLALKAPTGRYEGLEPEALGADRMGNGAWEITTGLNLTKVAAPFVIHADLLGFVPLPTAVDGESVRYSPGVAWALSVELPIPGSRFAVMVEAAGRHQGDEERRGAGVAGSSVHEVTLGAGVEYLPRDDLQILFGYVRTAYGVNVPANDQLALTIIPSF